MVDELDVLRLDLAGSGGEREGRGRGGRCGFSGREIGGERGMGAVPHGMGAVLAVIFLRLRTRHRGGGTFGRVLDKGGRLRHGPSARGGGFDAEDVVAAVCRGVGERFRHGVGPRSRSLENLSQRDVVGLVEGKAGAALADKGFLGVAVYHGGVYSQGAEKVCDLDFCDAMLLGDAAELGEGSVARVVLDVARKAEEGKGRERAEQKRGVVGIDYAVVDVQRGDVGELRVGQEGGGRVGRKVGRGGAEGWGGGGGDGAKHGRGEGGEVGEGKVARVARRRRHGCGEVGVR